MYSSSSGRFECTERRGDHSSVSDIYIRFACLNLSDERIYIRTLVPTDPLGFVHGATIVASECTDFAARHPSGLPSESLFSHTVSFLCL